jgi:hypothetical protein
MLAGGPFSFQSLQPGESSGLETNSMPFSNVPVACDKKRLEEIRPLVTAE